MSLNNLSLTDPNFSGKKRKSVMSGVFPDLNNVPVIELYKFKFFEQLRSWMNSFFIIRSTARKKTRKFNGRIAYIGRVKNQLDIPHALTQFALS